MMPGMNVQMDGGGSGEEMAIVTELFGTIAVRNNDEKLPRLHRVHLRYDEGHQRTMDARCQQRTRSIIPVQEIFKPLERF